MRGVLAAFVVPSVVVGLLAGLLVATGAPAAAGVANIGVGQEGLSIRVSWSYDAGDDSASVEISASPDFPETTPAGTRGTCFDFALLTATVLMHCDIAFVDTVWVRVTPTGGVPVVVGVPSAGFDFRPAATPAPVVEVRNRQKVRCRPEAADWANIDEQTLFTGRIMSGSDVREEDDLPNPITGKGPSSVTPDFLYYRVTPDDLGQELRCEVTATNEAWSVTRAVGGVVGHAKVVDMQPRLMLLEVPAPKHYVYYTSPRSTKPSRRERRAGAVSQAKGTADYGVSGSLQMSVTIYRTSRQAERGVQRSFCRDLRRRYRHASTPARPQQVLSCRKTTLPGASRAYAALAYGGGVDDFGNPVAVLQGIVVGSARHAVFVLSSVWGGSYRDREKSARRALKGADVTGTGLARAGARE
jgi:hypothetical protein